MKIFFQISQLFSSICPTAVKYLSTIPIWIPGNCLSDRELDGLLKTEIPKAPMPAQVVQTRCAAKLRRPQARPGLQVWRGHRPGISRRWQGADGAGHPNQNHAPTNQYRPGGLTPPDQKRGRELHFNRG